MPRSPLERSDAEVLRYFDADFTSARSHFRAVCDGLDVAWQEHGIAPDRGAILVAEFGPRHATSKLVVLSGLHGIEGYCGFATQIALLHGLGGRSAKIHVILVHGINPLGAAAFQRANWDNIDLNRNLVGDHQALARVDAAARAIVGLFSCPRLSRLPDSLWLTVFVARLLSLGGPKALMAALAGGQFFDPKAPFYGGDAVAPELIALLAVLKDRLQGADPTRTILFDLHSGIGRRGATSLLANGPTVLRTTDIFGVAVRDGHAGGTAVYPARGDVIRGLKHQLGLEAACGVTFECGTGPALATLLALRAANSAATHFPHDRRAKAKARRRMWAAFCPQSAAWRTTYVRHASTLVLRAFNHLTQQQA